MGLELTTRAFGAAGAAVFWVFLAGATLAAATGLAVFRVLAGAAAVLAFTLTGLDGAGAADLTGDGFLTGAGFLTATAFLAGVGFLIGTALLRVLPFLLALLF